MDSIKYIEYINTLQNKHLHNHDLIVFVSNGPELKAFRRNWARLIQKIYQIDPLLCPKCQGAMKLISFIEYDALIKKTLMHLGLWETRNHDPPKLDTLHTPAIETELTYDYTYSQLPPIDYWTQ